MLITQNQTVCKWKAALLISFNILSLPTSNRFHIRKCVARKQHMYVHSGCFVHVLLASLKCVPMCERACVSWYEYVCTPIASCVAIMFVPYVTYTLVTYVRCCTRGLISIMTVCTYVYTVLVYLAWQLFCNVQVHGCVRMIRKSLCLYSVILS